MSWTCKYEHAGRAVAGARHDPQGRRRGFPLELVLLEHMRKRERRAFSCDCPKRRRRARYANQNARGFLPIGQDASGRPRPSRRRGKAHDDVPAGSEREAAFASAAIRVLPMAIVA